MIEINILSYVISGVLNLLIFRTSPNRIVTKIDLN